MKGTPYIGLRRRLIGSVLLSTAVVVQALGPSPVAAATWHGSVSTHFDMRKGDNSSDVRQDQDWSGQLDLRYGEQETDTYSAALTVRAVTDIDGRRPGNEPGIYNGIQETFRSNLYPSLHRAWFSLKGPLSSQLQVGRQYRTEGDALWFDGAELRIPVPGVSNLSVALYGGVPVRLFDDASENRLIGGEAVLKLGRARWTAQAYHVEDHTRFGMIRQDIVARLGLTTSFRDRARFLGHIRYIDDGEFEGQGRLAIQLTRGIELRTDYRFLSRAKGEHANELDAASFVLGRGVGAARRPFHEIGADIFFPITERFSLDIGARARDMKAPTDEHNRDFERAFATFAVNDFMMFRRKWNASLTLEAYEMPQDFTRTASGDVSVELTPRLTASAGTSYAIYSYDYTTGVVRDNVRVGTARLVYRPSRAWRLEARYDGEHDDYRLHHFARLGARYDF